MVKSQESFNKKEVRNKKEKKRKEKEKKRLARKESGKSGNMDDMIAYVDEFGMITSTPPDPSKKAEVKLEDIEIGIPRQEESEKKDSLRKGTVSFFNNSKGYGFIRDAETKESIFVHFNNLLDKDIHEGSLVSFETGKGPKGPMALQVRHYSGE